DRLLSFACARRGYCLASRDHSVCDREWKPVFPVLHLRPGCLCLSLGNARDVWDRRRGRIAALVGELCRFTWRGYADRPIVASIWLAFSVCQHSADFSAKTPLHALSLPVGDGLVDRLPGRAAKAIAVRTCDHRARPGTSARRGRTDRDPARNPA